MNWLNEIADELIARHPEGEILIESGGSPSGTHHIGHMRELVTADAILLELHRRGRQARHIYFVDDLDNLRKIPINVPTEFEKYLGVPICDVPAPDGSDQSYADYFLKSLIDGCAALGIEVEFIRSHEKYRAGFFVPAIERSLERLDKVRTALTTISGRALDEGWSPIQILEQGRLKKRKFLSIDKTTKTIQYQDANNTAQTVAYDKGEVKLDWRLDWPGRWWLQDVQCEPSGRDHMTKGSSYDTGVQIMHDVYEGEPPYPVSYDFINMVGDTKKMSASKGTGLDATEGSKIMPPEVVRYFILSAAPLKRLYFDPVHSVVQLMDEFAAFATKTTKTDTEKQLWYVATRGQETGRSVGRVPFSHLLASYQASLRDATKTLEIIKRTEYAQIAEEDSDIIRHELQFIDVWLDKRAPEDVKFELAPTVDPSSFSPSQRTFLQKLGDKVAQAPVDADGTWFHDAVYGLKDDAGLAPKEMFTTLYQALIAKDSGPRAGWFLTMLPRDWLINRLRLKDGKLPTTKRTHAATSDGMTAELSVTTSAQLTKRISFSIDPAVRNQFPHTAVGYLVAELPETPAPIHESALSDALQAIRARGITTENLTAQPEIAVWRAAFKTFGVKPSKYLSSAEALAKRALRGEAAHVNPVVDAYNAISLKHLVPMGALDLDKLQGNVVLRYGRTGGETAQLLGVAEPVTVEPTHVVYADQIQVVTWLWNYRDASATAVKDTTKHAVFFADSLSGIDLAEAAIRDLALVLQKIGANLTTQGIVAL